ncbi:MAG: amidase family protein, partial [Ilumatobacteraceae bacterium]
MTDANEPPISEPDDALGWHDAVALADAVRSGATTPSELTEAAIARIEGGDDVTNAVILRRFDAARAEADAIEPGSAPFAGVPMLVKDLGAAMAGEPTYLGTRVLKEID